MNAVVFDLGNVLIEWDPSRIVSERFIADTDFYAWNAELDLGVPFDDVAARWTKAHPAHAEEVRVFQQRWLDTLGAVDDAVVAIVEDLRAAGTGVFGLTNSHALTLQSPEVRRVLAMLDGVVVSGEIGIAKPDRAIFDHTTQRFGLAPTVTWFVDDNEANVAAASACGWNAIHFSDAATLRDKLSAAGLVPDGGRSS